MADLNISNIDLAKISRADIEKQFANDPRLDKMLSIFDKINSLDNKEGEYLSEIDLSRMKNEDFSYSNVNLDYNYDKNITDDELENYFNAAKEFYGEDIQLEDYKTFLEYAVQKGDENSQKRDDDYEKKIEEVSQTTGMTKELIDKLGGPYVAGEYKSVIKDNKKYYEAIRDGQTVLRDETGKLVECREEESINIGYEGCEEITTFDENGEVATESYINSETGEQTRFEYGDEKSYKMHFKDGVAVRQSTGTGENKWKDMQLEDVVFGAGSPDSTKVSFKYDENNKLSKIEISEKRTDTTLPKAVIKDGLTLIEYAKQERISNKTSVDLQQMIDGGARYGQDFDLKMENGELKIVPKIKNETGEETPELKGAAFDKYKELVSKGIHANEDFEVEYDKDGNFRYSYKNNQAKEFDAEYKSEIYNKDGNLIDSLIVRNGEVIRKRLINGEEQTQTMSFEVALKGLLLEKNFAIAGEILGKDDVLSGGYNIYPVAEEYKQMTGRELIGDVYDELKNNNDKGVKNLVAKLIPSTSFGFAASKEEYINAYQEGYQQFKDILVFNPYESQVADLLPKIQRVQHSETSYTEQINNDKYDVDYTNGVINITKNGKKTYNFDVSKFPQNYVKNLLLKTPATVLYDLAASGIKLVLNDSINDSKSEVFGTTNGFYRPVGKGQITLDPNALIGDRAIKTIVHETGHGCDHIDNKENAIKAIKEMMKGSNKTATVNELLEIYGTLQPVSPCDEKLKTLFEEELTEYKKNRPNVNENAEYALDSKEEFFAESYTLLNLGSCKSEYVLANYFPKSLARVKEIMEENRKYKNQ